MRELEVIVRGPAGSGKSTIAREIAILLQGYGFDTVINDDEGQHKDGTYAVRLASLVEVAKKREQKLVVRTQQSPRQRRPARCKRCGKRWCGTDLKLRELYPADFNEAEPSLDSKVTDRVTYGSKKCREKGPKR